MSRLRLLEIITNMEKSSMEWKETHWSFLIEVESGRFEYFTGLKV